MIGGYPGCRRRADPRAAVHRHRRVDTPTTMQQVAPEGESCVPIPNQVRPLPLQPVLRDARFAVVSGRWP